MKNLFILIGMLCLFLTACNKDEDLVAPITEHNTLDNDATIVENLEITTADFQHKEAFEKAFKNSWAEEEAASFNQKNGQIIWEQLNVEYQSDSGEDILSSLPFVKNGMISAVIFQHYQNGEYKYSTFEKNFLELTADEIMESFDRSIGIQVYASFFKHQFIYNQSVLELTNKTNDLINHNSAKPRCFVVKKHIIQTFDGSTEYITVWYELVYVGGCGGGGGLGTSPDIPSTSDSDTPNGGGGSDHNPDSNEIDWEPGDCEPNTTPHLAEQIEEMDLLFPACQNKTADQIIEQIMSELCDEVDGPSGDIISMEMVLEKLEAYDAVNKSDFLNNPKKFTKDLLEAVCSCEYSNEPICDLTSSCPDFVFDNFDEAMKLFNSPHTFNEISKIGANLDCESLDDLLDDYECFYMKYQPVNYWETVASNPGIVFNHLSHNILATRLANCTKAHPCGSIAWNKLFTTGGPPSTWINTLHETNTTINGTTIPVKFEIFEEGFPVSLTTSYYEVVETLTGDWAKFEFRKENTDITGMIVMVPLAHAALFGTQSKLLKEDPCKD